MRYATVASRSSPPPICRRELRRSCPVPRLDWIAIEVESLPRKDLRALFSNNLLDLDAVHVLSNRDDEREAFDTACAEHRRFVRDERPPDWDCKNNGVTPDQGSST